MEKITSISQLKKGDKIWTINTFSGAVDVLEFVCIHPHNEEYSIFLNMNYDGMPKFYNKHISEYEDICYLRSHHGPNGGITMGCVASANCPRMKRYDKLHKEKNK